MSDQDINNDDTMLGAVDTSPPARNGKQEAGTQIASFDSANIVDYFKNLTGSASVKMKISRTSPSFYRGKQVSGLLDTIDELIDEDEIKSRYGGGKYTIQ